MRENREGGGAEDADRREAEGWKTGDFVNYEEKVTRNKKRRDGRRSEENGEK